MGTTANFQLGEFSKRLAASRIGLQLKPNDEASILKRTTATGVSAATRRLGYFAARGRFRMSCHHPPHWY